MDRYKKKGHWEDALERDIAYAFFSLQQVSLVHHLRLGLGFFRCRASSFFRSRA